VLGHNPVLTRLGSAEWIGLRKGQLKHLSEICDKLVCLSSWFYEVLEKNKVNVDKLAFIEQGLLLNETQFIAKTKPPLTEADPVRLVFLGRLDPIKGLDLLLSVITGLNDKEIFLDLYGPVEENYLQELQPWLDKKNITYKGLLKRNEVLPTLSIYDAIIVPSMVTEMAPLVLQEAFAAGIPAIASDVAGNAACVRDNVNGWLFKSGNKDSLKRVLTSLLHNKSEFAKIGNSLSAVRTMKNIGNEHLNLYVS
jgi:glycosyltransferase involved in cell wall biosynthesis